MLAEASALISISYDRAINYAFQQNAIPVIKELKFQNDASPRRDLVIRVSTEPAFASLVEIRLQSIAAQGEYRVSPLELKLSHDFLFALNEKLAGWLKVEVVAGETVICSRTEPVSLLARNEWCGLSSLPEILAAFILPNDPAVMTILSRASELLRDSTQRGGFNGYQDKSHKRAWDQAAAIYKAVGEVGIRYIVAPAIYEVVRKAYSKQVYVDRAFQKKTNELVQKHIGAMMEGAPEGFVKIDATTIDVIKKQAGGQATKVSTSSRALRKRRRMRAKTHSWWRCLIGQK